MTTFNTKKVFISGEVISLIDSSDLSSAEQLISQISKNESVSRMLELLQYRFVDNRYLLEALSHTSFVNEFPDISFNNNERLEFLGDSIVGAIITSLLTDQYSNQREGELSRLRGALVNESSFAELARVLGMDRCLLLGRGEFKSNGMEKEALLSDAFEALMGAIYLDSGFERTKQAFDNLLAHYTKINNADFISLDRLDNFDAKTRLQEKVMAIHKIFPTYHANQLEDSSFKVELYIGKNKIAETVSVSKKRAEKELARQALKNKLFEK